MADVEVPVTLNTTPMNKKLGEAKEDFKKLIDDLKEGFSGVASVAGAIGTTASVGMAGLRAGFGGAANAAATESIRWLMQDATASQVAKERVASEFEQRYKNVPKELIENNDALKKLAEIMVKRYVQEEERKRAAGQLAYPIGERVTDKATEAAGIAVREKLLESMGITSR